MDKRQGRAGWLALETRCPWSQRRRRKIRRLKLKPQKEPEAIFGNTGLDPRADVRRGWRAKARRLVKLKKADRGSSSGLSSSSNSQEEDSSTGRRSRRPTLDPSGVHVEGDAEPSGFWHGPDLGTSRVPPVGTHGGPDVAASAAVVDLILRKKRVSAAMDVLLSADEVLRGHGARDPLHASSETHDRRWPFQGRGAPWEGHRGWEKEFNKKTSEFKGQRQGSLLWGLVRSALRETGLLKC